MSFKNLSLQAVRVTEAAAIASYNYIGKGDKNAADGAAVDAMRSALNHLDIKGTVVIGEGEMDEAPMLYIGEKVGSGLGIEIDIALDPIEGTIPCANAMIDSTSVMAFAKKGNFLNAPDIYMDKIAVGKGLSPDVISLKKSPRENIINVAKAKGKKPSDMVICTLLRDRHQDIIDAARSLDAKVKFIDNGDVGGVISTFYPSADVDIYMGKGGAPEGVIAAAALRCIGGQMQARLCPDGAAEIKRCTKWGISDLDKIYNIDELANGDVIFCATGITSGPLADGVRIDGRTAITDTLLMQSRTGTIRKIHAMHNLNIKDWIKL